MHRDRGRRVFGLGCGSGALAAVLAEHGYRVAAVDPSESGIRVAREENARPGVEFHAGSAYDDLSERFCQQPTVISLKVIEHIIYLRKFAAAVFELLQPGGTAIIYTPYHGYMKNLVLVS